MLGLGMGTHKIVPNKQIVRDGLVLYLDGKDFKNTPPTTVWRDRSDNNNNATVTNFGYINNIPASTITDFTGKISGDANSNPNIAKHCGASSLTSPSNIPYEEATYDKLKVLDNVSNSVITSTVNYIPQQLFQFNIISAVEKMLGKAIPTVDGTTASKINWIKLNVNQLKCNAYIYGACPTTTTAPMITGYTLQPASTGKIAYLDVFNVSSNAWSNSPVTNTASSATLTTKSVTGISSFIDSNGMVNLLAFTNPSNGTTVSTIYCDYISLEIDMADTSSGSDNAGGVIFDGIDDYCSINNSLGLSSDAFTIKFKASLDLNQSNYTKLISKDKPSGDFPYAIDIVSNKIRGYITFTDETYSTVTSNFILYDSKIVNDIVFKYDGSYCYMYINGVLDIKSSLSTKTIKKTSGSLFVGKNSQYLKSNVKQILYYNRALTDQEIQRNYLASK